MHSEWEKGRRNLATGSINALQTTPTNEMLSFHFSRFCLSQSQGSRREREFCSLNLEFRDENEIFLSISQGSRRDRDIFFQVSCFEMGLRDEINQILTRIFEIENSCYALVSSDAICIFLGQFFLWQNLFLSIFNHNLRSNVPINL